MGPVCPPCYQYVRIRPAACAQCGRRHPLIGTTKPNGSGTAAGICGPCSGAGPEPSCTTCDSQDSARIAGQCLPCVVRRRVGDRLTRADGTQHPQLAEFAEALADSAEPVNALRWLSDSPSARLMVQLTADHRLITHDLLDELPPGHAERFLRHTLIATGVLPPRNDDLDRIPAWLDTLLTHRPPHHSQLLRPFATWVLLRRARRQAGDRTHASSAAARIRHQVHKALSLMDWLDVEHLDLADLDQTRLDAWLAVSRNRHQIKPFLSWAAQRGLAEEHIIATPPATAAAPVLSEEQRWQQLRRCLNSNGMPLETRVAGALILLYGLPGERVRYLTTADLHADTADETYLHLDHTDLWIPPRLADLLRQLAKRHASAQP
jgi:hypothetical protein